MAMWWIPAGHIPSVAEARDRLEFRRTGAIRPVAFSFTKPFPDRRGAERGSGDARVSFDNRVFVRPTRRTATARGDAFSLPPGGRSRVGDVWGRARPIRQPGRDWRPRRHGSTCGITTWIGRAFRAGIGQATPEVLPDGRLRLHEEWQWTNGDLSAGRSDRGEVRWEVRREARLHGLQREHGGLPARNVRSVNSAAAQFQRTRRRRSWRRCRSRAPASGKRPDRAGCALWPRRRKPGVAGDSAGNDHARAPISSAACDGAAQQFVDDGVLKRREHIERGLRSRRAAIRPMGRDSASTRGARRFRPRDRAAPPSAARRSSVR